MAAAVEDLDGQGLADALVANHAALLAAEARELVLAAQWADLHPAESLEARPVLAGMESEGILVDRAVLARLSGEFATSQSRVEKDIYGLAAENFNIGSPKQLGDILFGRMGLPGGRKTQTGAWSTDSDVLEDLASQGVDLAGKMLDWRQLSKLRST